MNHLLAIPAPRLLLTTRLWGFPDHMAYLELQIQTLKESSPEKLVTYKTISHSKFITYDGIDINGKRVCDEIRAQVADLKTSGDIVTKLSIIAYSLGGLILRYAVGILFKEGFFDEITPVNFVTFCSPHVGAPSPKQLRFIKFYDWIAPKFLAVTGNQLFLCDTVLATISHNKRSVGKPMLVWMADPELRFYKGLAKFRHLALYANGINDKRTAWFTALISRYDPFCSLYNKNPDNIHASFLPGYEPTVVDASQPITFGEIRGKPREPPIKTPKKAVTALWKVWLVRRWRWLKVFCSLVLFTPVWAITFIGNSVIQRVMHNRRVQQFHKLNNLEDMYHQNPSFASQLLAAIDDERDRIVESAYGAINTTDDNEETEHLRALEPLNLTKDQQFIVDNLNSLSWKKFPVVIRKTDLTHAAAINRHPDPHFGEGKTVVKHFIDNTFSFD